jgi:hypothetical protein
MQPYDRAVSPILTFFSVLIPSSASRAPHRHLPIPPHEQ